AILIRKLASKSRLIGFDADAPAAEWLAPAGDPRQGVLLWGVVGAGAAWAAWQLWRRGEETIEPDAEVDAGFKQIMPFSNLLGMAPIEWWAGLLAQARFRVGLKYVPRLAITLIASTAGTLLALPERVLGPLVVAAVARLRGDAPDPVFLVGMNRSGTTHLHNVLALDPQFRSPRNYEVFNPHGFLTGWLTTAVLTPFMTWRRPMDSVQMTIVSSQEEEFALATMGNPSPYWSFCLPKQIARHDRYLFPEGFSPRQRRRWERHYRLFLRKLTVWRRRTPLLKNPANTGRVAWLAKLFPNARFVHIVRHPHAVYRSNLRFASQGQVVFQLQDPDADDNYATRCLDNYRAMADAFARDTAGLPAGRVATIRFEDLEREPEGVIDRLYDQFGLEVSRTFRRRRDAYLDSMQGYRKNRYTELPDEQRQRVDAVMGDHLRAWGYGAADRDAA
ncbi:MAG: sulfotransferase, partial [Planctomycetota bacterium]